MKVTYFALAHLKVGDGTRAPGDLVPEASGWPYIGGYVRDGKVAPVLVSTLSQEDQDALAKYEADQEERQAKRLADIEAARAAKAAPVVEEVEDDTEEPEGEEVESYDAFTVKELLAELEARGVDAAGTTKKADLIALLEADDESEPADDDAE